MIWLKVISEPVRNYIRNADCAPHLDPLEARHAILLSAGTLRADSSGGIPNVTARLENGSGQASALLAFPPLGARAELRSETGVVFAGTVSEVTLGREASMRIDG